MGTPNGKSSVPPFVDDQHPQANPPAAQVQNPMSLVVMAIGWLILTVAMVGGGKVLWDVLSDGLANKKMESLSAQVIALGLAFVIGWIVSLINIRSMGNLILPRVIRLYITFTLAGIVLIYLRVALKLLTEIFVTEQYLRYTIVLLAGFFALSFLHLLVENFHTGPLAFVLLITGMLHLLAIVFHYVFLEGDPKFIGGDVYFLVFILIMAGLLGSNLAFLNPIRSMLNGFSSEEEPETEQ
jgi:hypothetical protein